MTLLQQINKMKFDFVCATGVESTTLVLSKDKMDELEVEIKPLLTHKSDPGAQSQVNGLWIEQVEGTNIMGVQ